MHNLSVQMMMLLVCVSFYSIQSYPQFSIPFVSWNNKNEPSRFPLNVRIGNPFNKLSNFGKPNTRQGSLTRNSNEVVIYDKIVTVTPNSVTVNNEKSLDIPITSPKKETQNENNKDGDIKEIEEELENKLNLEDDGSKTENSLEYTTDYTTETTTDYESTTYGDDDLFNRSGVSGHVVASLLG